MSIGWGDLVDVPAEEDERLLEPWEIYLTDPTVKQAVDKLLADPNRDQGLGMAQLATEVAKTVAPSPHNIAAQDARYLLCPEAARKDEVMWRANPHTGLYYAEDAEDFTRIAEAQAGRDGPAEDSPDVHLSAGLTNRAGVAIGEDTELSWENAFDAPVPPTEDEGDVRVFTTTAHFLAGSLRELIDTTQPWIEGSWEMISRRFGKSIADEDYIPVSPASVEFEEHGGHMIVRFSVHAVPDRGRTWSMHLVVGIPAEVEDVVDASIRNAAECTIMRTKVSPCCTTIMTWDRHVHRPSIIVVDGGRTFQEVLAQLFDVPLEQVVPMGEQHLTEGEQDPDS